MSKIVILNGSIRKKSTYSLLKRIGAGFADHDIEFLNISDYKLKPCIGCEHCLREGTCLLKDDANELLEKLSSADGIILGTPVYLRQVSGLLKVLIDRGCSWYHRSPLVGKPILFASTTQVSGSKNAMKYLEDLSVQWGCIHCGSLSRTMFNLDKEIPAKDLRKFSFYLDPSNRNKYRVSLKELIEFQTQKVLAVYVLPLDREFWSEKGYLDKPYFYDCRIHIFKRIIAALFYKMLSYFISKNKSES